VKKMETRTLPKGWSLNRIADVCYVNPPRKNMNSKDPNFQTSFIPMSAIDEITGSITQKISRPFSEVSKGYTYFENGDILFAKITPCMQNGKSAIAENLIEGFGFGSTEFHVLRSKSGVNKEWIYHFIRTQEYRKRAQDHFEGSAGQQRVSTAFIENSLIPLPPTTEDQSNIANELERKMAEVEKMRQAALRQKEAAEAIMGAILRDVFTSNGKKDSWRNVKIAKIAHINMGQSPDGSTYNKEGYGTPLLNGPTEFGTEHPTPLQWTTAPKKICEKGDLILCVRGNTTGRMNKADQEYCLGRGVAGIRGKGKKGNTDFLAYALQFKIGQLLVGSERSTFPNLGRDELNSFEILAPEDETQQGKIANEIKNKLNTGDGIVNKIDSQLEAIHALPAAILREVFDFQEANA